MKITTLILVLFCFSAAVLAAESRMIPEAGSPAMTPASSAPEMVAAFAGPQKLLEAARRGDTAAQLEIAILYEYGFNMPDNEVYALAWYILAADGSAKAAKHRDRLLDKLPDAKVAEARKMSQTLAPTGNQSTMSTPEGVPQQAPSPPEDQPMPIEEMPEPIPETQ